MNLKICNREIDEKLIVYLMILNPFIDLLNGIFEYVLKINLSPGVIIRSLILIIIIFLYVTNKKVNLTKTIFIFSLFLLQMLVLGFNNNLNIISEISFISKIYYNIFLLFIISEIVTKKEIDYDYYVDKLVLVNLIVTSSLVITRVLGLGVGSYGEAGGYKGLYMGLNDVTAVLTISFPFILYKLIKLEKKLLYGVIAAFSAINIVLLGTKTSMVIIGITILFFIYQVFFKEKKIINIILVMLIIIVFIFIFERFFWDTFNSTILTRLKYFSERQDFATFLVSGRNETLIKSFELLRNNLFYMIFGTGFTIGGGFIQSFLPGHVMIEMDLFDVIYFYGFIMFIIIYTPLFKMLIKSILILTKSSKLLYKTIALVYILTFIISFLGGHIILSPLSGIYFIIIYGLLKAIKDNNKVKI